MFTLFISDLHLDLEQPAIIKIFIDFLATTARKAEALYILGDLFEAWLGDDAHTALKQEIKSGLRSLADSGVPVYIMSGNRDFLLGEQFTQEMHCKLIKEPKIIDLYGTRTLLMHGDLLCTDDKPYLKYRAFISKRWVRGLIALSPLIFRQWLARWGRSKSKKYTRTTDRTIMDATQEGINDYIQRHRVTQLIHGHTHRPALHFFRIKDQFIHRIVLSDWNEQGNVLVYFENGEKRLGSVSTISEHIRKHETIIQN